MENRYKITLILFLFILLSSFWNRVDAHAADQSYTFLRIYAKAVEGRIEMNTKDLNKALNLSLNDGLSAKDIEPFLPQIYAYLTERVSFASGSETYKIVFTEASILAQPNLGDFVQLNFQLDGMSEVPDAMDIKNEILFDKDPTHRSLLVVEYNWKAGIFNNEALVSLIFGPKESVQELSLTESSIWKGFVAMVKMGVHHIWIGIDHILFLLALVLPSVMFRRRKNGEIAEASEGSEGPAASVFSQWLPVEKFKPAFIYLLTIVTLFTVAHTITLSLAALGIVVLPSRMVESIIAFSIALAAYHNIKPFFKNEVWVIAFGFGLFHGFGFASVLGEIGLAGDYMVLSLLGFNLGVELGQILIIALIFPVLFLIRKLWLYPRILIYGSVLLILIALYWFVERAFDIDLPVGRMVKSALQLVGL